MLPSPGTVKVWSTADGQLKHTLEGPGGSVDWLAWHPKGDVVLAGSEDFTMWMWSAGSGSCMQAGAALATCRGAAAVQLPAACCLPPARAAGPDVRRPGRRVQLAWTQQPRNGGRTPALPPRPPAAPQRWQSEPC
jgi:WD40 repeat protein